MFLSDNVKIKIIDSLKYILELENEVSDYSSRTVPLLLKNIFDIVHDFRFFTEIRKQPVEDFSHISIHFLDKKKSLFYLIGDVLKDNKLEMTTINQNKSCIAMLDYFSVWYLTQHLNITENSLGAVERKKLYNHYASFNLFDEATFNNVYLNKAYKQDVLQKVYLLEDFSLTLYNRIKKIHKENSTELNKNIFEKIISGIIVNDINYSEFKNSAWGKALGLQSVSETDFIYEHKKIFQNKFFNFGVNINNIQQIVGKCPEVLSTKDNIPYVEHMLQRLFSLNKHDMVFQRHFSPEKIIFFIDTTLHDKKDFIKTFDTLKTSFNNNRNNINYSTKESKDKVNMIIQFLEKKILDDELKSTASHTLKKRL